MPTSPSSGSSVTAIPYDIGDVARMQRRGYRVSKDDVSSPSLGDQITDSASVAWTIEGLEDPIGNWTPCDCAAAQERF